LERLGWSVTYLQPDAFGCIHVASVENAIQSNTLLVSLMMVNNETGNMTDFQSINKLCKQYGICYHSDATQALGKIDLRTCQNLPDLISFSGHKIYAPKGIGALLINSDTLPKPLMFGGGQERNLRPGTVAVHQVVALAASFDLMTILIDSLPRIQLYKDKILTKLLSCYILNSTDNQSVPHIISLSIPQMDWEELYQKIPAIAVSNGSACNAKSQLPSHVMKAHGHTDALALATIRISLSYLHGEPDIDFLIEYLNSQLPHR
jgi:cysteine desulfurase